MYWWIKFQEGFQGRLWGCTVDGIGVWLQLCCIEDVGRHFWRTGSSLLEVQHGTREGYGERGSFAIGWIRLNWVFSLFVSAAQMLFFWLYANVDQVRLQLVELTGMSFYLDSLLLLPPVGGGST